VAAALDLGAGARGEDAQHGDRLVPRVELARGHDADVAQPVAVGATDDDREVALEAVARDERVGREHRGRPAADGDDVPAAGQLARRTGDPEVEALGQLDPVAPVRGQHACPFPRALLDLGREGDVRVQRLGHVVHERAQQGGAGRRRGAGRDGAQQLGAGGPGGGGRKRRHGGDRSPAPATTGRAASG